MDSEKNVRIIRTLFTSSMLVSVVLAALIPIAGNASTKRWAAIVGLLGLLTVAGRWAILRQHRADRRVGLFVTLATVNLLLIAPELALRTLGYEYVSGIRFGHPEPEYIWRLEPDKDLLWRLPSSNPAANSMGFVGREPEQPKPAGRFRVLFLGDSCTEQGFPALVEDLLRSAWARDVDCVPLALSGYSSYQGRVLAERHGAQLEPDLVFVYFGWNDHWRAFGPSDSAKVVNPTREKIYRKSRMLQVVRQLRVRMDSTAHAQDGQTHVRVPLGEFESNLRRIHELFDEQGVPVCFITAPTSYYQLGVPDYFITEGDQSQFARSKKSAVALHREYAQVVREVTADTGALLLDLEAEYAELEDVETVFLRDGIHFTPPGLEKLARRIAEFVQDEVVSAGDSRR